VNRQNTAIPRNLLPVQKKAHFVRYSPGMAQNRTRVCRQPSRSRQLDYLIDQSHGDSEVPANRGF